MKTFGTMNTSEYVSECGDAGQMMRACNDCVWEDRPVSIL